MTFPIAVGTGSRHSSSRPFPQISRAPNIDENEEHTPLDTLMAMGTNADETLIATVFIGYHFLPIASSAANADGGNDRLDNQSDATIDSSSEEAENRRPRSERLPLHEESCTQFNVIAELRVQITHTTSPFASNADALSSRETKSRVPLGAMRRKRRRSSPAFAPNPSIEFSSNETHLACIIPLPTSHELILSSSDDINSRDGAEAMSTMVIFRVQTKQLSSRQQLQQRKQHQLPKLPDYIAEKSNYRDKSEVDATHDNNRASETNDTSEGNNVLSQEESTGATKSHAARIFTSYIAHEPRIVRAPREVDAESTKENGTVPNRSFLRKLSGGAKDIVKPAQRPVLHSATCVCNVPFDHFRGKTCSACSLLLVGTAEGKLLLVDYATAGVHDVVDPDVQKKGGLQQSPLDPLIESNGTGSNSLRVNPIVHIAQCTPTVWKMPDIYGEEQGSESKGRIATVLRDGSVCVYTTSFVPLNTHSDDTNGGLNFSKGLEMRTELLSTFHASKMRCDASCLRYMCARWLNPLVLVLLTRSPYLDEGFRGNLGALLSEIVVAQVWTVAEVLEDNNALKSVNRDGWAMPCESGVTMTLVSELKVPFGDGLDDLVHDTFSLTQQTGPVLQKQSHGVFPECARGMSILHHQASDSVAISSQAISWKAASAAVDQLEVRPFCLIWDWKRNVQGFTMASKESYCVRQEFNCQRSTLPSLFSWFHVGGDDEHGLCAVHVYEQTLSPESCRLAKRVFTLSTLSPSSRHFAEGTLCVNEPSPILLHRDSVTFPLLSRATATSDVSLQWEEARVPPAYVASNGPCQLAATGKAYGRSIAVAASRGLCVLDLSRIPRVGEHHNEHEKNSLSNGKSGTMVPSSAYSLSHRWKQFSNVNDEQRFRVVDMVWWEQEREDLLLATVKYPSVDSVHLVCWSQKSLGFGTNQLLKDSSLLFAGDEDEDAQYGLVLPSRFHAVQWMSIITDPADGRPSNSSAPSNRALLLLAYASYQDAGCSCMNYAVYQLQAIQTSNGKYELVLAKNSACGRIPLQIGRSPDFSAPESVSGVFIAGGSFLFDLQAGGEDQDASATIGIVTIFQGLIAVCISEGGPTLYRPSLLENASCSKQTKGIIASYWVSGTFSSENGCRIAWNIAKSDGNVFCWSVPCSNTECGHHSRKEQKNGDGCAEVLLSLGLEKHSILGDICHLGQSSLWMNGGNTSEREIALGPFRPLSFGCTLYAGQRSRTSTTNSFHVSNSVVAPPQFTPSLFISFLSLSSSSINRDRDREWQLVNGSGESSSNSLGDPLSYEKDHITSILGHVKSLGSSSSALRVITLKVIDLLNESKSASDAQVGSRVSPSDETELTRKKWTVGKAMLQEIVLGAKKIYDTLGFTTFFLSVGRQLEPHQFNLIFPLPSDETQTAEDLFSMSCQRGSLATALSALPLFSDHRRSQQSVTKLLYHCLLKIEENFQSCSSHTALTSGEDEAFLHQLFWFGVKLEDAIEIENSLDKECESEEDEDSSQSVVSSSSSDFEESSIDEDTEEFVSISSSVESYAADYSMETYSSEESNEVSFLTPCRTPRKKARVGLVKKVVRKLFASDDVPVNAVEEDAINEAASSFILSGFDELSVKSPASGQENLAPELKLVGDKSRHVEAVMPTCDDILIPSTVAGAVCIFMRHAIAHGETRQEGSRPISGWKAVSAVAHLLQGDRETEAISSAGSSNAQSISRTITIEDFLAATTPAHQDENTRGEEDPYKTAARRMHNLMSECCNQIHSQAVGKVFNLVLLLLLRYESCPDVQLCKGTLFAVGIVTGNLSGRLSEVLDLVEGPSCDMIDIYSVYISQLDS